jgi:hypothetical protein
LCARNLQSTSFFIHVGAVASAAQRRIDLEHDGENHVADWRPATPALVLGRFFHAAAKIEQQPLHTPLFFNLGQIVHRPILRVRRLLREGHFLGLRYSSACAVLPRHHGSHRVDVFARQAGILMVGARAKRRLVVRADRVLGCTVLAWNDPYPALLNELLRRRDDKAAFFSRSHGQPFLRLGGSPRIELHAAIWRTAWLWLALASLTRCQGLFMYLIVVTLKYIVNDFRIDF